MKLPARDAELYYTLMWSLQCFINEKHQIITGIKNVFDYSSLTMEEKVEVRTALFKNKKLIRDFVKINPYKLGVDLLDIISSWENFIADSFFIERCLKKHAIFIREDDVYGVLGLYEGFGDMIDISYFPIHVETILLPFKGKIIYDGLFYASNASFGNNIAGNLKDVYMDAKNKKRIQTCLN